MSTACFDLIRSIPIRLSELDSLTTHAKTLENKDEQLYNSVCRACCVLISSHLEAFLKDLVRSITSDLNYHLKSFGRMPKAMQDDFCRKIAHYEGVPTNEIDLRVKQLKAFFLQNSVAIDLRAFPYRENQNKNPSYDLIESTLSKVGVPRVLHLMSSSAFQVVFDNDERTNWRLQRDLRSFASHLYAFPYRRLSGLYELSRPEKKGLGNQTLWHTFIEDVMNRRHRVVHGDTLSNTTTWEELHRDVIKLGVLMNGLLLTACSYIKLS